MPLPFSFSNNTTPTGVQLDSVLAALGALGVIPCSVTGTNALTLTPFANTPTVPTPYNNIGVFAGIAAADNTGGVTAQIGSGAALVVYRDTEAGPVVLIGGEIVLGNALALVYDQSLNGAAGGFHLLNPAQGQTFSTTTVVNATIGTTLAAAALTGSFTKQGIIHRTGTNSGGFNDTTDTAANIIASIPPPLVYSTFRFRYFNDSTGQTSTLVGGANVTIVGPATTANDASHDFIGVVTAISGTPTVSIYG